MDKYFHISNIPCILLGEESPKVYLYIHGQYSSKEAARGFAEIVNPKGWQVLALDLPAHGEREEDIGSFFAWNVIPELRMILEYAKQHWKHVALRAHSIGAYFAMLSFPGNMFENVQFVSPILNMENTYELMMKTSFITLDQLEKDTIIETSSGLTFYWTEYCFARKNPVIEWTSKTAILYGENDTFTTRDIINSFVKEHGCEVTLVENGEHWFHTSEQILVSNSWTERVTPDKCRAIVE